MAGKKRLDLILVERGLAETRARARSLIMAGQAMVNGETVDKAGFLIAEGTVVSLREPNPYVSRGGLKLAKAIDEFGLEVGGRIVLDVGASTGGFTDCCLQSGAVLVYAVDVGYGQLAWKLREDERVINLERTNIRHLQAQAFTAGVPDFCCIDVAFISLRLVLPVIARLLAPPAEVVMLIKPQFEAGREQVGKKGVVRDPEIHVQVLDSVLTVARKEGFYLSHLDFSPIQGPQGNIEYLAHGGFDSRFSSNPPTPAEVVDAAQANF
ncbi:MAG: TlyA family RNA methyltransferase [Firmicutes bacterium]|nr:TlyA family RNA methyltransferase [Bacillota bacterium]